MKGLLVVGIPSVCFYLGAAMFFDYRYDAMAESYCDKQDAEIMLDCIKGMDDRKPNMLLGPLQALDVRS